MTELTISVVMPIRGRTALAEESVRSVLNQAGDLLELIIVDGGSTDEAARRLDQLVASDNRVFVLNTEQRSLASDLNMALSRARGTVIGILLPGDLYGETALQYVSNHFSSDINSLMGYGQVELIDDTGRHADDRPTPLTGQMPGKEATDGLVCASTMFFRRTLWVLLGNLDERSADNAIHDYWTRACTTFTERVGAMDAVLAQTRQGSSSHTAPARVTLFSLNESQVTELAMDDNQTVHIALEGSSKNSYNRVCGSDFEKDLALLKQLVDRRNNAGRIRTKLYLEITLMPHNIGEMSDFLRLAARVGANRVYFKFLNDYPDAEYAAFCEQRNQGNIDFSEERIADVKTQYAQTVDDAMALAKELGMPADVV